MALRRLAIILVALLALPGTAQAGLIEGLGKIVSGVFEVPASIVAGTLGGPPIIGTVVGAVAGTLNGAKLITFGALETVVSAIPLALKLLPFLL